MLACYENVRELTKTLRVELLPDRADAGLPRLSLLQLLVQLLLQICDVQSGCRRARHVLHPELPIIRPFSVRIIRSVKKYGPIPYMYAV